MLNRKLSRNQSGNTPHLFFYETHGDEGDATRISSIKSPNVDGRFVGRAIVVISLALLSIGRNLLSTTYFPSFQHFHQQPVSPVVSQRPPVENAFVRGSRVEEGYAPVPSNARRKFIARGKGTSKITSAFLKLGWQKADDVRDAHFYFRFMSFSADKEAKQLLPFQRYGRIPGYSSRWESKDKFFDGLREYSRRTGYELWFIPATYRLTRDPWDREEFAKVLDGGGMKYPWVLKKVDVNNGAGITMIAPHSDNLRGLVQRVQEDSNNTFIAQQYVCNELTWTDGEKFDLRMFFLVASIDPLIVLFGEGYVRAGAKLYNESDWTTTGQHLTNSDYRGNQQDVTNYHLWKRLQDHFSQQKAFFQSRGITDPVIHVRNQMKEALGRFAAAFEPGMLENAHKTHKEENNFGFYGCDFIIDADLDVWFIEAQSAPGMPSESYHLATWDRLFPPMINIVEEISIKQEIDPKQSILPLKSLDGGWEVVYAGGEIFEYEGYSRSKDKKSCVPSQLK